MIIDKETLRELLVKVIDQNSGSDSEELADSIVEVLDEEGLLEEE